MLTSGRSTCEPSTPTRLGDKGERSAGSSHFIISLRISHLVPRAHNFLCRHVLFSPDSDVLAGNRETKELAD